MGHHTRKFTAPEDVGFNLPECARGFVVEFKGNENWHTLPEVKLENGSKLRLYAATQLSQVRHIWKQFQRSAWHTPFQNFDWINAWFESKNLSTRAKPLIILGFKEGQLQFILPFATETYFGLRRLVWAANEVNDYNSPLIKTEFLPQLSTAIVGEIYQHISRHISGIDVFYLTRQPKFLAGIANPFVSSNARRSSCDSHSICLDSNWNNLYTQQRSAKSRSRLRQKTRRLKRAGKLHFMAIRGPQLQASIDRILQWKSVQLEQKGERNPFDRKSQGSVLTQTIRQFASVDTKNNPLRVYGLFLDGEMIAGLIAFVEKKTFSLFTMSYGPEVFTNCSAGSILLVKTIELAARAKLLNYDFLAGDEPYKLSWCDQKLDLYDCVFATTGIGQLGAFASNARLEVKKSLKASIPAMNFLKKTNRSRLQIQGALAKLKTPHTKRFNHAGNR